MTLFGSTVAATYRADGLRASKSNGSGTTQFLYDGGEPIVELNSSGSVTALNVFARQRGSVAPIGDLRCSSGAVIALNVFAADTPQPELLSPASAAPLFAQVGLMADTPQPELLSPGSGGNGSTSSHRTASLRAKRAARRPNTSSTSKATSPTAPIRPARSSR